MMNIVGFLLQILFCYVTLVCSDLVIAYSEKKNHVYRVRLFIVVTLPRFDHVNHGLVHKKRASVLIGDVLQFSVSYF